MGLKTIFKMSKYEQKKLPDTFAKFGKTLLLIEHSNFSHCYTVSPVEGIPSVTQLAGIQCTFRDPFPMLDWKPTFGPS